MSDISKALGEPFPRSAIKHRTGGGGKSLAYVEGHTVIHRLNDATGNSWSLEVRSIDSFTLGTRTLLRAHVALTIPGLGTREHIGVQAVEERGGEDLVKGAITDALKKAATLFGVGLELYGPDYEAGEVNDAPPRNRSTSRNTLPDAPQGPLRRQEASEPLPGLQPAPARQHGFIEALMNDLSMSLDQLTVEVESSFGCAVAALNRRDASVLIERLQQRRAERPTTQAEMLPDVAGRARS